MLFIKYYFYCGKPSKFLMICRHQSVPGFMGCPAVLQECPEALRLVELEIAGKRDQYGDPYDLGHVRIRMIE
jgi:hypothetical protein